MNGTAGWFILLIAGIFLIVIGFEGALGLVVGVAFTPGSLRYYSDASPGFNTTSSTSSATSTALVPTFTL